MKPTVIDARAPVWPTEFLPLAGIAYVASGQRFADEAAQAAAQLRRSNPTVPICFITDQPEYQPVFWDHLVTIANPHFGFRDKILMGLCPYERFLYLDTDTYVVRPLDDVFALLLRFDFVGHQLFEGHDCPLPDIPDAFPEFNGGVLGFRRSPVMASFFSRWLDSYNAFYALNRDGHYDCSNASDQKTLRLTVWQTGGSVGVLGPEFNFVPHHVNFACTPVKIIHGRGERAELERRLNAHLGNRVYVPRLDSVISSNMPPDELRRLWLHTTLQLLRAVGVWLVPIRFRNWLRQSEAIRSLFLQNPFDRSTGKQDPKWHQPDNP